MHGSGRSGLGAKPPSAPGPATPLHQLQGTVGLLADAPRRPGGGPDVVRVPDGVHLGAPTELRRACERLREDVAALHLPLDVPGAEGARQELAALLAQLDDYLLPRLRRIDAPLLAVVGGSTGAGKSTLVNSLVRRFVTRSGILRPTTRSPVLIHHPYDSGAFLTQRILPGFARVTSEAPEPLQPIDVNAPRVTALRLVPDEGLAPGLAIIDAPDIDSLVETNRDLALQLLAAADLWIFVTTAARYSDAVPWDTLRKAVDRGVSVAVVLDRVPAEAMAEVRVHLATMLRDRGLSTAPLFTIPETTKEADGFLPEEVVRPLHGWLSRLARDSRSRDIVVRRTLVGALDSLNERVRLITAAAQAQVVTDGVLRAAIGDVYDDADTQLRAGLRDAGLLQGEVQARWQEYVGSGEAFRGFDGVIGRLRERVAAAVRGRSAPSAPLAEALRKAAVALAVTTAGSAVETLVRRWRAEAAGQGLLREVAGGPALPASFPARAEQLVRDWYAGVQDVIRAETHGGRPNPRAAAFGVEGLAGLLVVLAFSDLNALATPTVAADGAMAVVADRLLRAVLGGDAPAFAVSAREALQIRLSDLLATERARFEATAEAAGVRGELPAALRSHLRAIEGAR
ncbi:MAG TPA: dynamin family protein [Kineosporiaceae bacterium]